MCTRPCLVFASLALILYGGIGHAQSVQASGLTDSLDDIFPLALDNQWHFSYSESWWDLEAGTVTHWDGPMHFRIIGVSETQDSSLWVVEQVRDLIYRFYLFGVLANTYPINDTINFELVERHNGHHQIFRLTGGEWINLHSVFFFTSSFTQPDSVFRYRRVNSTGMVTFTSAPQGYSPYNFDCRRGVGILSLRGSQGFGSGGAQVNHQLTGYSITSADKAGPLDVPRRFSLEQNFPNPFNPTTTIRFAVVKRSLVTLKVYDLLGREIAVLVNKEMQPGTYEEAIHMSRAASGVYLYRLQQGQYVATKSMLLLK